MTMSPMKSAPQKEDDGEPKSPDAMQVFRQNFWSLFGLISVLIACYTTVQLLKKPGQMSVIESQAMDMTAMLPPRGALPVGIASVERGTVSNSVTYTGTVQAFNDDDIYPRISGRITNMPVYPGDRVKKGQLLVQLDLSGNSEYSAEREQALYAEDSAQHNAGIAKSELSEKKYSLEAAKAAEQRAVKSLEEAEANLAYWKPEIERQSALLKTQVVSLDEYQKELAEMKSAQARVEEAQAAVREANNTRLAAQSALDMMVHHVGHQSSTERQAAAALRKASIQEQYTRIFAPSDGVVTKRLISPGVLVSPGMLLLKVAEIKKIRVQAQVANEDAQRIHVGDKVYVKASERDGREIIASISSVFPSADAGSRTFTVEAVLDNRVASVESKDTRIGTLAQYRFLPGQYVIMRIVAGERSGLSVPTAAILWREGRAQVWKVDRAGANDAKSVYTCIMHPEVQMDKPGSCPKCGMDLVLKEAKIQSSKAVYTCIMHPEVLSDSPGRCPKCGMDLNAKEAGGPAKALLVDVETGLSNPDRTEIISGLNEGEQVVFAGYESLAPGMSVVAAEWGENGPVKLPEAAEVSGSGGKKSEETKR